LQQILVAAALQFDNEFRQSPYFHELRCKSSECVTIAWMRTEDSMTDFDSYVSPFSWRYGSPEMRRIWSEINKRRIWRRIWLHLAEVQAHFGLVSIEQVEQISSHVDAVDITRAFEIESEIHHDLMAELKTYAEQCGSAGGILHLGATSMDIEDNADALRLREALGLIISTLQKLLLAFASQIDRWSDTPVIAFTHLQPAEPTTLGYRLATHAQDLLEDWEQLNRIKNAIRGKGFKGAVGTAAAYLELLGKERFGAFEERLSDHLGIPFYPISTQTYPRKQDYQVISALAGLGATIYKFAFDLRLLQSPPLGELSEPFGEKQVGSSAMPFKRNPIRSEKIDSLARSLAQMPQVAWQNAAHSLLERTLDDSANRRSLLPEAFLIVDEILMTTLSIIDNLKVDEGAIVRNFSIYAPFAGTERLLMGLVHAGGNRQEMHAVLRTHALSAWNIIRDGQSNPLSNLLSTDPFLQQYLTQDQIRELLRVEEYTGIASDSARTLVQTIRRMFTRE
jgi:adenylosuccinate lyase